MKVALFMASDEWGGAEDIFVALANAMAEVCPVVVFLVRGNKIADRFASNIELQVIAANPSRLNPFFYLELVQRIRAAAPDVVHTHGAKATALAWRVRRLIGIPVIGTKHNSRRGSIFNRLDHVTAVSRAAADSVTSGKAVVIYNGLRPNEVSEPKSEVFTIRAVGRLEPVKQYHLLVAAASQLEFPFRVEIAGSGSEMERLSADIERLGLTDQVSLLGYREDTDRLIAGADLLVICSETEGFSMVLVEALFYGRVLISTPVGGSSEILPERLLFDADQLTKKIEEVYQNYQEFQGEFSKVRELNRDRFELESVVQAYLDYYQQVLGQ